MHHTGIEYNVRDQNSLNQEEQYHRDGDIDCWLALFYPLFSAFHRVIYIYTFCFGIFIVQIFLVKDRLFPY